MTKRSPGSRRRCRCRWIQASGAAVAVAVLASFVPPWGWGRSATAWGQETKPAATANSNAPRAAGDGSPSDRLAFANGLLKSKRYALAESEYEAFLKTAEPGPETAEALYGLANAQMFQGQFKEARKRFQDFLATAPNHPNRATAQYRAGELSYLLGEHAAARSALEAYVKAHPKHPLIDAAWRFLGDVHLKENHLDQARRAYEQSLETAPNGRYANAVRLNLAKTLTETGEFNEAYGLLKELTERGGKDWLDKAYHQLGLVHLASHKNEEAVKAFLAMETAAPQSSLISRARLDRAEALRRLGKTQEAEALARPIAEDSTHPMAPRAAFELGELLLEQGGSEEAFEVWDAAYKRFPDSSFAPALLFNSAEAARTLGRKEEARRRFQKVADATPNDPWADDSLARAAELALELGDLVDSRRLAASLAARYPESALIPNARLIEGRSALAANQPKEASEILSAIDLKHCTPRVVQATRYYLALASHGQGETAEALETLRRIGEEKDNPFAPIAWQDLGIRLAQSGEHQKAVEAIERYLATAPPDRASPQALTTLCLSASALGQRDKAAQALEQLAKADQSGRSLAMARVRLGEAAYADKRYDEAVAVLAPAANDPQSPLRPRALSALGWSQLRGGSAGEAATTFGQLIEGYPNDPLADEAILARGEALAATGQANAALAAYAQASTKFQGKPRGGDAILARARLLTQLERHREAAAELERFLAQSAGPPHPEEASALAELGWAWLDSGDRGKSDSAFRDLLKRFPGHSKAAEARICLAESAFLAKDFAGAGRWLAPLVADPAPEGLDPMIRQSALYRWGRAQIETRDDQAAATFSRLLETAPQGSFARQAKYWKAEAALRSGDSASAADQFAKLLEELQAALPATRDPETAPAVAAGSDAGTAAVKPPVQPPTEAQAQAQEIAGLIRGSRLRLVQALVRLERWDDAIAQADRLGGDAPKMTMGQRSELEYARGRIRQGQARFDEARKSYRAVIADDRPENTELAARSQFMIGETYFHDRDYENAAREYLKVDILYQAPEWEALALLEVGKVYEMLKDWSEAARSYEELIQRYPDHPKAGEAAKGLAKAKSKLAGAKIGTDPAPAATPAAANSEPPSLELSEKR